MEHTQQKTVLVVVKADRQPALELGETMCRYLTAQGHQALLISSVQDNPAYSRGDLDLVVVLGGDGTMLGVARRLVRRPTPILGVNFGRVGFLTMTPPAEWRDALDIMLSGRGHVQAHMALEWTVTRGEKVMRGVAVNDVVVCRGAISRVNTLDIFADEQRVCQLRADGLIISSPIGSTAYTVSAGGPLLHPSVDALVLTPICPFLYKTPPVVLPPSVTVRALLHQGAIETYLTADGQEGTYLEAEDEVRVRAVPRGVLLAFAQEDSYFDRLCQRGFMGHYEPK